MTPYKIVFESSTQRFFIQNSFNNLYLTKDKNKARLLKHHLEEETIQNLIHANEIAWIKNFRKESFNSLYYTFKNTVDNF